MFLKKIALIAICLLAIPLNSCAVIDDASQKDTAQVANKSIANNEELEKLKEEVTKMRELLNTHEKNVNDNKGAFYDLYMNFWNALLTIIGFIIIILGSIGYKNIKNECDDIKNNVERNISVLRSQVSEEIRNIKSDYSDYKSDINNRLENGLDHNFKKVTQKIMESNFHKPLEKTEEKLLKTINELENVKGRLEVVMTALLPDKLKRTPKPTAFDEFEDIPDVDEQGEKNKGNNIFDSENK